MIFWAYNIIALHLRIPKHGRDQTKHPKETVTSLLLENKTKISIRVHCISSSFQYYITQTCLTILPGVTALNFYSNGSMGDSNAKKQFLFVLSLGPLGIAKSVF